MPVNWPHHGIVHSLTPEFSESSHQMFSPLLPLGRLWALEAAASAILIHYDNASNAYAVLDLHAVPPVVMALSRPAQVEGTRQSLARRGPPAAFRGPHV